MTLPRGPLGLATLGPALLVGTMFLSCAPAPVPESLDAIPGGEVVRLVDVIDRAGRTGTLTLTQRLLGAGEDWPEAAGAGRAFVGKDLRDVLYVRTPGSLRFPLRPDPPAVFRFAAGLPPEARRTSFVVTVEWSGQREMLERFELEPGDGWSLRAVDLGRWSGKSIVLELANPDGRRGRPALWGNPRLVGPRGNGPNVILYLIDTLRADRLGVYGYSRSTSPVMDRLAASGALFEDCFAQESQTLGSIPSLLASLYPPTHGIDEFGEVLAPDVTTLPQVLRQAGYSTGSFITNINAGTLANLDRGFDLLHDAIKSYRDREALRSLPEEAFFRWLDAHADTRFFAYIHTAEPHRPYTPPPPYDTLFDRDYRGSITGYFDEASGYAEATDPEDIDHVGALYDSEIRLADDAVGRLVDGLTARGLMENTILVITSDHGEELMDHGSWNHGQSLYNELLRVPLILHAPGRVPSGLRVAEPVQLIDVAPTVLELAGFPSPEAFEGESLVPLLGGDHPERFARREVYARASKDPVKMAVIRDGWKAIFTEGGDLELYHLPDDPGEKRNLAEEEREIAAALVARLKAWIDARADRGGAAEAMEISPEDLERLRTLGYLP